MDEITPDQLKRAQEMEPEPIEKEREEEISDEKFEEMLKAMNNPVDSLRDVAVKIKIFLDKRIKEEMSGNGILTDHTRRWVESYEKILEKIQKALHGDKSVNLHVHKITHGEIAAKMREVIVIGEKKEKEKKESE